MRKMSKEDKRCQGEFSGPVTGGEFVLGVLPLTATQGGHTRLESMPSTVKESLLNAVGQGLWQAVVFLITFMFLERGGGLPALADVDACYTCFL